jgi:hypothetical protein
MKISGIRILSSYGRPARMMLALVVSLMLTGDTIAALRHNYLFNSGDGTTVVDSVPGGLNGTAVGGVIDTADNRFVLDGADNYVTFDGAALALNSYTSLTLELWSLVSPVHEGQYTAMAAFGGTTGGTGVNYIMMQPTRAGGEGSSGAIIDVTTTAEARVTDTVDLSDGRIHHTVLTISGTAVNYYVDGNLIGTAALGAPSLSGVSTARALLGDSVWDGDPLINGAIYEFRVYDDEKSATDVTGLYNAGCQAGCGNMYLEVDRDTGAATLFNGLSLKNAVIVDIGSAKGALDTTGWQSITNNFDSNDGGEFDVDDEWQITSQTPTLISEEDFIGQGSEDGGAFANGETLPLGNLWTKSPFEDLTFTLTVLDANFIEQSLSVPVFFVNGPNDAAFSRSDFDLDGDVDEQDYLTLKSNHLKTLTGILHIDTFDVGDINGDLVNDYRDFRLFKADFIAANGAGAFANLLAASGSIPEPSALVLLMCGAAGLLTTRRRQPNLAEKGLLAITKHTSESCRNMHCITKPIFLIALFGMIPSLSQAQAIVVSETFDARTDTAGIGVEGGATLTLVNQGVGDNAMQFTSTSAAGGFFAAGFAIPALGIEPGPGGPNISSNLVDYRLSFDLTINAVNGFTPNLEVWLADGPRFGTNNANLYSVGGLTNGVNNVSFTLNQNIATTAPNGFASPGAWSPAADDWWLQVNSISFAAPAGATVDYTIDNIQVTVNIAPSLALVVDPVSGKARIRNVSAADVIFDYYRIESTNGSLLTANYNGTTGWNSLDDQDLGALGGGIGESWEEVTDANSANRLIEQFLAGDTTLQPGQSIPLGAPVNPAILNNQLGSLAFRIGGAAYADVAIAQVMFETLSDELVGDYNEDGTVDAADYTVWRDRLGQASTALPNRDPNNAGNIGTADYASWKSNFGAQLGAGSESGNSNAVPEPAAAVLFCLAIFLASGVRNRST